MQKGCTPILIDHWWSSRWSVLRPLKFEQRTADALVQLTLFCLNNVITQYGQNHYTQTNGIVTGDNHSVPLANIAVHYI